MRFFYNSDLSGDVKIQARDGTFIDVPGDALIEFVAEHVRNEKVAQLETADPLEVLGIPKRQKSS